MHTHSKFVLAALAATMLLALGVSTATAGRFRISEQNFEAIWNRAISGRNNLRFSFGSATVACPVTLLASFVERTIKKETLIRQNQIHHAVLEGERCEGGTATVRRETLPWESRYRSFTGTLPRIREIRTGLIGASFRIRESNGLECEVTTEVNHPGIFEIGESREAAETGLATTGEPENITAERPASIPLSGGFNCIFFGEGHVSGIGLIRNLPVTAKITITLI